MGPKLKVASRNWKRRVHTEPTGRRETKKTQEKYMSVWFKKKKVKQQQPERKKRGWTEN